MDSDVGCRRGTNLPVFGRRGTPLAVRLFVAFAIFVLVASLRYPLLLGSIPRWEMLDEERWNPLLVLAFADVSLVSGMVLALGGKNRAAMRYAGVAVLLLNDDWASPEMGLPAVAGK